MQSVSGEIDCTSQSLHRLAAQAEREHGWRSGLGAAGMDRLRSWRTSYSSEPTSSCTGIKLTSPRRRSTAWADYGRVHCRAPRGLWSRVNPPAGAYRSIGALFRSRPESVIRQSSLSVIDVSGIFSRRSGWSAGSNCACGGPEDLESVGLGTDPVDPIRLDAAVASPGLLWGDPGQRVKDQCSWKRSCRPAGLVERVFIADWPDSFGRQTLGT
jgi:hypothetical protein